MSTRVLGFDIYAGTVETAGAALLAKSEKRSGGYVVLGNVHVLVTAQRDELLADALRSAWTVLPDGAPVAWLQRRTGAASAERVAGAELMLEVMRAGARDGTRHALLGSTEAVLSSLRRRLDDEVPGLEIVAALAPGFGAADELGDAADEVAATRPDIVWVALGAPKQEQFMLRHAARLDGAVAVGVGAAFDFLSGNKRRAPAWMQRSGLEWTHRLATEPRRLAGRYIKTNSAFLYLAARDLRRGA